MAASGPHEITQTMRVGSAFTAEFTENGPSANKLCGRLPHYAPPRPCKLTFDLLILKVVSDSRVTWATSVPISVFLSLSFLDLGPMYATDRQTSDISQTRIVA